MDIQIIPAHESYFRGFYDALSTVAAERIYIEMTEPPPFERVCSFQRGLIEKDGPVTYALRGDQVVGWCDIFPEDNPRQCHRGSLGMGLLPGYRGQGIGTKLLTATLAKAKAFGLEKAELKVYTSNDAAVALYRKCGFDQEGLIKSYRKVDGRYFDCLVMGKFL